MQTLNLTLLAAMGSLSVMLAGVIFVVLETIFLKLKGVIKHACFKN